MKCSKIQALLSAYIDNNISSAEILSVKKHLANCKECPLQLNAVQKTKNILAGLKPAILPEDFEKGLLNELEYHRREENTFLEDFSIIFLFRAVFHRIRTFALSLSAKTAISLTITAIILGLGTFLIVKTNLKEKIPINLLLVAHNEQIKSSDLTNKDVSNYVSANIKCDMNNIILAGDSPSNPPPRFKEEINDEE